MVVWVYVRLVNVVAFWDICRVDGCVVEGLLGGGGGGVWKEKKRKEKQAKREAKRADR